MTSGISSSAPTTTVPALRVIDHVPSADSVTVIGTSYFGTATQPPTEPPWFFAVGVTSDGLTFGSDITFVDRQQTFSPQRVLDPKQGNKVVDVLPEDPCWTMCPSFNHPPYVASGTDRYLVFSTGCNSVCPRGSYLIFVYDRTTRRVRKLLAATGTVPDRLDVSGDYVVWTSEVPETAEHRQGPNSPGVWVANLVTGDVRHGPYQVRDASLHGNLLDLVIVPTLDQYTFYLQRFDVRTLEPLSKPMNGVIDVISSDAFSILDLAGPNSNADPNGQTLVKHIQVVGPNFEPLTDMSDALNRNPDAVAIGSPEAGSNFITWAGDNGTAWAMDGVTKTLVRLRAENDTGAQPHAAGHSLIWFADDPEHRNQGTLKEYFANIEDLVK